MEMTSLVNMAEKIDRVGGWAQWREDLQSTGRDWDVFDSTAIRDEWLLSHPSSDSSEFNLVKPSLRYGGWGGGKGGDRSCRTSVTCPLFGSLIGMNRMTWPTWAQAVALRGFPKVHGIQRNLSGPWSGDNVRPEAWLFAGKLSQMSLKATHPSNGLQHFQDGCCLKSQHHTGLHAAGRSLECKEEAQA